VIYYTDNRLQGTRYEGIFLMAQKFISDSGLPIVCCSLRPVDFGDERIVLEGRERSYPTMALQILTALEASAADYVFFCEHDVLYHPSHFDFAPPTKDLYYYNVNNWRWLFPQDHLITYNELTSLSSLCVDRELAIRHYKLRLQHIEEQGLDKVRGREPRWARRFGYEPGTKPRRRGGITDEEHVKRRSALPNIDIRHKWTFSRPKVHLDEFRRQPTNWRVATMDEIQGWDLRGLFGL
jgi:hypothetical protein